MKNRLRLMTLCGLLTASTPSFADSLFRANTVISDPVNGTQRASASFSSVTSLIDYFQSGSLSGVFSGYSAAYANGSAVLTGQINYMGVAARLTLPAYSGVSAKAVLYFPGSRLTFVGTGATRDEAVQDLTAQVTGHGGAQLNLLQSYLAGTSPVSPLAGNPNSLQSNMADSDFNSSAFNTAGNASKGSTGPRFGMSASGGQFSSAGFSGTVYSVPISYTYRFTDSGWQLQMNLPLTYEKLGGSSSYSGQFGVGLQIPVHPGWDWYIIPMGSVGATASTDFGAAGSLYSFAVSSRYTYHFSPMLDLTLGNMIGEIRTAGINIDNYDIDPKINDTAFKNGLISEYITPYHFWGQPISVRGGYAYTLYTGTKLYMNGYSDLFLDTGAATSSQAAFYKRVRLGVHCTLGKNYTAVSGQLGYTF